MVTFGKLLRIFWSDHNPERPVWSRQYKSIIFYHDETQRRLAVESKEREVTRRKTSLYTEVRPFTLFYQAEAYHQKYHLRRDDDVMAEFRQMYPTDAGLVRSTAAARVNGYLAGHGSCEQLTDEVALLGLTEGGQKKLLRRACK